MKEGHIPQCRIERDVSTLKGASLKVDVVSGGFPCQAWSLF